MACGIPADFMSIDPFTKHSVWALLVLSVIEPHAETRLPWLEHVLGNTMEDYTYPAHWREFPSLIEPNNA
jgi:hypothetical protein